MDEYILDLVGPVQFEVIMTSLTTLQAYKMTDVYTYIEKELGDDTNYDSKGHRGMIYGVLKENLHDIILKHGIRVSNDASLDMLNLIAKALIEVVEDYDPAYILNEVDLTVTDEHPGDVIFAKLLEHLYDVEDVEVMDVIEWFDDALIRTMNEQLSVKVIPEIETLDPNRKSLYLSFLNGLRKGAVFALIESGLKIGQYDAKGLMPYLEETLAELPLNEMAFELASLILVSNSPVNRELITSLAGYLVETDNNIMTLRMATVKLLEDYLDD